MKSKRIISLAVLFLLIAIISTSVAFSSVSPWKSIDNDSYSLVKAGNGKYLAYRILQDKDKQNIRTMICEQSIDGEVMKDNWKELRKGIISSLTGIKDLNTDDKLTSIQTDDFEASFDAFGEDKIWKFHKVTNEDGVFVIPEEADNMPIEFAASDDGSEYLVATEKGLWKIDANEKKTEKISKESYNGKSYEELLREMNSGIVDEDEFNALFWNSNLIISPDGTKVVYSSNRDCTAGKGYSLWLYNLKTGEEKIIAKSASEFYVCIGWLDSNTILCQRSSTDKHTYCFVDDNGNISDMILEGEDARVLNIGAGLIAYTPNNSVSNEVCIMKYDLKSKQLSSIYKNQVDGVLRGKGSFNEKGTKFAYLYAPKENEVLQYMSIAELTEGKSTSIKQLPVKSIRTIINNFNWIGSEKLFINIASANDGLMEESSWVYTYEGGK